jgi:methionyl-tRNA formyltransferase
VVLADRKRLVVQTGQGTLEILRLRPEGKRTMSVTEFLAGHKVAAGDRFDAVL